MARRKSKDSLHIKIQRSQEKGCNYSHSIVTKSSNLLQTCTLTKQNEFAKLKHNQTSEYN